MSADIPHTLYLPSSKDKDEDGKIIPKYRKPDPVSAKINNDNAMRANDEMVRRISERRAKKAEEAWEKVSPEQIMNE